MIKLKNLLKEFEQSLKIPSGFSDIKSITQEEDRSWLKFKVISKRKYKIDDIKILQSKLGKHPAGYGFYSFKEKKENKNYIYTWECSRSSN